MIFAAPSEEGLTMPGGSSPFGKPDGLGTASSPMTVKAAVAAMSDSGPLERFRHVHLLDGWYRGADSMLRLRGLDRFRISAQNAWLDGEFVNSPGSVGECQDFTISGMNFLNSYHNVLSIGNCNRGNFVGVGAWCDPPPDPGNRTNDHVITTNGCVGTLFHECFGFGWGRKAIQVYRSVGTSITSGWFRFDGWHPRGNRMAIAPSYRSYDTVVRDCFATCSGSWNPFVTSPSERAGACHLIANDTHDNVGDILAKLNDKNRDPADTRWTVAGCTVYQPAGTRSVGTIGIRATDQDGVTIRDTNILMEPHPDIRKTLNLSGSGSVRRVNLGHNQWAKASRDWTFERVGIGSQKILQPSTVLRERVEEATRISRWPEVEWPSFPW